ncbi:MAG: sterol desaturase family protein [Deltaproteobacteria bacterium]|nr:MAG: sterol desaturase family protein [Deltaproteobacteria bacterium]
MVTLYVSGFLMWTVVEYTLHRFPFHYVTEKEPLRLLTGGLHLLHHEIPNRGDYVVSPILLSTPFYLLISGMGYLITGNIFTISIFMAGLALAYLIYEWIHYFTHHRAAKTSIGKYLKKHHMLHHFKDSNNYFGVTSPLWDWMFGTLPNKSENRETQILPIISREHS